MDSMAKDLLPLFEKIDSKKENLEIIHEFIAEFKQVQTLSVRKTKISKLPVAIALCRKCSSFISSGWS